MNSYLKKGMILISILLLSVLLVMMTTSMLVISTQSLNITGKADKRSRSMLAAEAGIEYARLMLNSDPAWGDKSHPLSDITVSLGNNQQFTITGQSRNNLSEQTPWLTTPPLTAEIICKGFVYVNGEEKHKITLRGIFQRDDDYPCPVYSGSDILMLAWANKAPYGLLSPVYHFSEKIKNSSPVRIHSNSSITLRADPALLVGVSLTGGYASAVSTVDTDGMLPVMQRENALPVKIPAMDIYNIIGKRSSDPNVCINLDPNMFYLVGYFEYDSNDPNNPMIADDPSDPNDNPGLAYCIPHSSSDPVPYNPSDPNNPYVDPDVYDPNFVLGIACISETSCNDFLNHYGDFYHNPPLSDPNCVNRNFYNYYSKIDFLKYDGDPNSTFQKTINNKLGMTMDASAPGTVSLTMEKDLYVENVTGFFETDCIGKAKDKPGGDYLDPTVYYPDSMDGVSVTIDMNGHTIYGDKLWLGIAPSGTGAIVSSDTIDFIHSYSVNMLALSAESIRMTYREPGRKSNSIITYRGIMYALDDILIQSNSSEKRDKQLEFYGSMVCKNKETPANNCTASPLSCFPSLVTANSNFFVEGSTLYHIDIVHTDDGLKELSALRKLEESQYLVRKVLCEEIK